MKSNSKPKLGRPQSADPRKIIWPVRLNKAEFRVIKNKAKDSGKTSGLWIRETLLKAAAA